MITQNALNLIYKTAKLSNRALDKREYLVKIWVNFCKFCIETYVVTPHLSHLVTTYGFNEK